MEFTSNIPTCECGCGQQTDVARSASRTGGVQAGDRLRFLNGHNKRKYRSEGGLYKCRVCKGLFDQENLTRDRNRHGELQDVGYCRSCMTVKSQRNSAKYGKRQKVWQTKSTLRRNYGLTIEDYQSLYEAQGGRCKVCGIPRKSRLEIDAHRNDVLHVDHSHKTGKVRGLLCRSCNHGLGCMKDDPSVLRAAAEYLEAT